MTVSVTPATFSFVDFDADLIRRIGDGLVEVLAIDRAVHVEVDESTPLGRVRTDIGDAITVHVESGAFEDSRKPRQQSEEATTANLGRALLRARDRISGGFGDVLRGPSRTHGRAREPAAVEVQLPQPPRLHRRGRRRIRTRVGC
jgi:hypothetical protein